MTSNGNDDKPQNTQGSKSSGTKRGTRQSARARARNAKKNVTIDLEAKDVTTKSKTTSTKPAAASTGKKAETKTSATQSTKPSPSVIGSTSPKNTTTSKASTNTNEPSTAKTRTTSAKPSEDKTPAKNSNGIFKTLISAIIGGVIAILGFLLLQFAGLIPSMTATSDAPALDVLEQRLAIVENLPAPEGIDPTQIEGLAKRIGSVETALDTPNIPEEVAARLTALETRLSQMEASGPTNSKEVTAAIASAVPAGLSDRLAAIETRLSAATENSGEGQTTSEETKGIITGLSAKLETLKSEFDVLKGNSTEFVSQLSALSKKVDTTKKSLTKQSDSSNVLRNVAQTVALDNLKHVAQSGAPFAEALQALKATGFPPQSIALIEPYADQGLPDTGTLKTQLDELIGTATARAEPVAQTTEAPQSALEKLLSNARSVIKIRKVDANNTPAEGALSDMQEAFGAGNPEAFKKAMDALENGQKELFSNWVTNWQARLSLKTLHLTQEKAEKSPPPQGSDEPASSDNKTK
ncbi:MAG: hypothetical protein ABJM86_06905 [Hyphomicrobiales bacterium]